MTGGYFQGSAPARLVRDSILRLCRELKPDAVALVDVIAPPDFILNSPIGHSDGQVRPGYLCQIVNSVRVGILLFSCSIVAVCHVTRKTNGDCFFVLINLISKELGVRNFQ